MGQCHIRHPHITNIIATEHLCEKKDDQHIETDNRPVSSVPISELLHIILIPDICKTSTFHEESGQICSVIQQMLVLFFFIHTLFPFSTFLHNILI